MCKGADIDGVHQGTETDGFASAAGKAEVEETTVT